MFKLSKFNMINVVIKLLILVAVSKIISLVILWYLPSEGVNIKESNSYTPSYKRVDFKNMLNTNTSSNKSVKNQKQNHTGINITNLLLKGLYGNEKKGFAVIARKTAPNKTFLVSVGEIFEGYKLKSIGKDSVIFVKNNKDFILKVISKKIQNVSTVVQRVAHGAEEHRVTRKDINYYSKHPDQIWKEISIVELKKDGKIAGFKVTRVKPGSNMAKLGIKKGDIIIKANNRVLDSYKSVFGLYKNINNFDAVEIVVLRNNQEKELVYEIN